MSRVRNLKCVLLYHIVTIALTVILYSKVAYSELIINKIITVVFRLHFVRNNFNIIRIFKNREKFLLMQ